MLRTIALRFSNNFAPDEGTIKAHESVISEIGYVWYGKLGSRISSRVKNDILTSEKHMILLIHNGATGRYWAYIDTIKDETPPPEEIPSYYRNRAKDFSTWFRVLRFEEAPRVILSHCFVVS